MKKRKGKIVNQVQDLKASLYRIISNYSEEPVSSEGCESLYVFTVSGFLDGNKHEDLLWWMFLALRREAPVSTRSKKAARYDRKYFIPYSEYLKETVSKEQFSKIVFVYLSRKTSGNEEERIWLEEKAKEGCMILANNAICFKGNDGMERFEKNSFYLPVNSLLYKIVEFNDDRYHDLLHFNHVYMRLLFYGNLGLQRSDYIMKRISSLAGNTDPLSQFYELIKICEYCIHMQALKTLCTDRTYTEKQAEHFTISRMSLGFLNRLQLIDITYHDPQLARSARELDMMLTGKNSSSLRQSRVTYMNLCELVVRLRNRYLGHGIMSEKVTFQMIRPLTEVMYQIVNTFVGSERLQDDDCIVSPEGYEPVPAIVSHQKETYFFCGYYHDESGWYADYLCFRMGLSARFSLNDFNKPVLIREKTSQESEETPVIPPVFRRETELSRDDQKKLGSAMQKTRYLPLVYDGIGENTVVDIWGTDHYSEFSVNLRSLYSDTTYGKTSYDEQHLLYLKTEHPMYLVQIDMNLLERFGWTEDTFAEKIFLDTIANGLLLP